MRLKLWLHPGHHVVVEVVHDPDGEADDDGRHADGGDENHEVPTGAFFSEDMKETHALRRGLEDGEDHNKEER